MHGILPSARYLLSLHSCSHLFRLLIAMTIVELSPIPSVEGQGPPVGTLVRSFLLTDESSPGMACKITSLGATLTHLWVPDSRNVPRDVVLGFDDINAYRTQHDPYFGASVGRIANR
jgi:aldose 1-epimerase